MDEIQKTNILSNFYSLRAGLSVISVEKAKFEEAWLTLENAEKCKNELLDGTGGYDEYYMHKDEGLRGKLKDKEASLRGRQYAASRSIWIYVLDILLLLLGILAIFGFAVFLGVRFVLSLTETDPLVFFLFGLEVQPVFGGMYGLIALIYIVGVPCGAIGCIIGGAKLFKFFPEKFGDLIYKLKAPKEIAPLEQEIADLKEQISTIENNFLQLKEEKEEEMQAILLKCFYLVKALEQAYGNFLDLRDWQHIDLIIFYFESHRAESFKEALQLVDRQVQTNSIVKAIGQATQELKNTILYSANKVAQIVGNGFMLLSSQISSVQSQIGQQNARIAELASAQNMNTALQQKADTNSLQLMEDVRYMRTLAENAEVQRRNNM